MAEEKMNPKKTVKKGIVNANALTWEVIDVGVLPNDNTGDPLRDAMIKVNNNFANLFPLVFVVNTTASYVWSNVHTFQSNVTFTGKTFLIANNIANTFIVDDVGTVTVGKAIIANGTPGTAGQFLTSTAGGNVYWSTSGNGTVTNVNTGVGLAGGPITNTGSISVVANNGIVANASGVFVNANNGLSVNSSGLYVNTTFISNLDANNSLFLGGFAANAYQTVNNMPQAVAALQANNCTFLLGIPAPLYLTDYQDHTISAVYTYTSNVVFKSSIIANNSPGKPGQVLTSAPDGNVYWNTISNTVGTVVSITTGNGLTGGPITNTGTISVVANTGLFVNASGLFVNTVYIGTLPANNSVYLGGKLEGALNVNSASIANNSSFLNNKAEANLNVNSAVSSSVSNNALLLGNKPEANLNVNSAATSNNSAFLAGVAASRYLTDNNNYVISGLYTYVNDIELKNSIVANGSVGTTGQLLTSAGDGTVYWSSVTPGSGTVTSVGSGNGLTGGPITGSGSLAIRANTGIVANATGVFVDAAFIGTLSANNASYLEGKIEADLNVNSAATSASSLSANNAAYLAGKLEADLDVKSAVVAKIVRPGDGSPIWTSGVGDPEGVVVADVGSLYTRTDGGANTTLYVKESGVDDTGWVAK